MGAQMNESVAEPVNCEHQLLDLVKWKLFNDINKEEGLSLLNAIDHRELLLAELLLFLS